MLSRGLSEKYLNNELENGLSEKYLNNELENGLRKLFAEHGTYVTWLINTSDNPKSEEKIAVTNRLLQNPEDFYDALKPLVGHDIASQFENALTQHLMIVSEFIQAFLNKEYEKKVSMFEDKIYENGNGVADFVSALNENVLPQDVSREVFEVYNYYILKLIYSKYVEGNWNMYIQTYDYFRDHLMKMAETVYNILTN